MNTNVFSRTYRSFLSNYRRYGDWSMRNIYQKPGMHRDYVFGWLINMIITAVAFVLAYPFGVIWNILRKPR